MMATAGGSPSPLAELHLRSSFQKSQVLLRCTWAKCQVSASGEKSRKPGTWRKEAGEHTPLLLGIQPATPPLQGGS